VEAKRETGTNSADVVEAIGGDRMTIALFPSDDTAGAEFSKDKVYRFRLWRIWLPREKVPKIACFCMLNPSTADEVKLDPTLRRCAGLSRSWNCTGMVIVNLFAVVSADPKILLTHPDPVGDQPTKTTLGRTVTNTQVILDEISKAHLLVLAWGAFSEAEQRAKQLIKTLSDRGVTPYCLGLTKEGMPGHPLFVPKGTKPIRFIILKEVITP
jgi:hypothetical protein